MKCNNRHIGLMLSGLLMLLLTACGKSETTNEEQKQSPVITFYVYAPEKPMPTRAGEDLVNALEAESRLTSLQIWVFTHDDATLVGYLAPSDMPSVEGTVYQMEVTPAFANAVEKPNVDVYVLANASSVGQASFTKETTRATLQAAVFGKPDTEGGTDYFGVASPTTATGVTAGLPMSGVLINQQVVGENPVLRIGNYDSMAKVQLQRAVSKVRFVFCRQENGTEDKLMINSVKLNAGLFPEKENLFLESQSYRIGSAYVGEAATLLSTATESASYFDPSVYVFLNQEAQDYEDLIDAGITSGHLTPVGPFYFRETDRKLTGTINYTYGIDEPRDVSFSMETEHGFTRNHSWIVYAYYSSDGLDVITVFVKPWTEFQTSHSVYNW